MLKLSKAEKLHLARIGLVPFFSLSLLIDFPYQYSVAFILFCLFWAIKVYARYLDRREEKSLSER